MSGEPDPSTGAGLRSISEVATAFGVPVSTLRYYDDIGLVPASHRRARVRHYDRAGLERLAYVQLWRQDALLSVEQTAAVLATLTRDGRNDLLGQVIGELTDRIARMDEAREMLVHLLNCPAEDNTACPVTVTYLGERVDEALDRRAGTPRPAREHAASRMQRILGELRASGTLAAPPGGEG